MSIEVVLFQLAEGAIVDTRQALSAVGLAPAMLTVDTFPAQVGCSLILVVDDTEEPAAIFTPGRLATFAIRGTDPHDVVILALQQPMVTPPKKWEILPLRLVVAANTTFPAQMSGRYTFEIIVNVDDQEVARERASTHVYSQQQIVDSRNATS
jgi:hypothetical protein